MEFRQTRFRCPAHKMCDKIISLIGLLTLTQNLLPDYMPKHRTT